MRNIYQGFGYLMAANFETIFVAIGAVKGADWLNREWPLSFSWKNITLPIAAILILHSWWFIFRMMRRQNAEAANESLHKK